MKQNAKICAIGEQNVVFILEELIRREREGEERGLRKGEREREDRDREKRDKKELSYQFEVEDKGTSTLASAYFLKAMRFF